MAHFFKIKISVVAAGDNFPDACTEESTDLEDVRNEALLPLDVSNLRASCVCTTEDDLEQGPLTQTPVADAAEVGMLFLRFPGLSKFSCHRREIPGIRARCRARRMV